MLVAFVLTQRRARQPITPLRLFASRERSGALVAGVLVVRPACRRAHAAARRRHGDRVHAADGLWCRRRRPEDAGAASGLVNVAHQLGGSLGLGILVTVFAAASRGAAEHPLRGVSAAAESRYQLAHAVATALTESAVFLALGVAVVLVVMRPLGASRVATVAEVAT